MSASDDASSRNGIEIRVLGPLSVLRHGSERPLGGPKQRAVLALLAAEPNRCVPVDTIVDGIWGEAAPRAVEASLHSYVSKLRSTTGVAIDRVSRAYRLAVEPRSVDATRFAALIREGFELAPLRPDRASTVLRRALRMWRGRPYADLPDVPQLDHELRRLEALRLTTVEALADTELRLGRHRYVIDLVVDELEEHPLHDGLVARYMTALYHDGQTAEALRVYHTARLVRIEELGIDPSPELQQLELAILQQSPELRPPREAGAAQRLGGGCEGRSHSHRFRPLAMVHP